MSLTGKIEEISIVDLMQTIHAAQKTGVLNVSSLGVSASVHVQKGQIVRASIPGMTNLGDMLLKRHAITREELDTAVQVQTEVEKIPLGMILEKYRVITHEQLTQAVVSQIEEVIVRLLRWTTGTFEFVNQSLAAMDDILVAPADLLLPEEVNTQFVLLEAARRFDEMRKSDESVAPPSKSAKRSDDKDEFSLAMAQLKQVLTGSAGEKRLAVSVHFLTFLSRYVSRAAIFVVKGPGLLGSGGFGTGLKGKPINDLIRGLSLTLSPESIPFHVIKNHEFYCGAAPADRWAGVLYDVIGPTRSEEIILLPISGVAKAFCLIYGDHGDTQEKVRHPELLEIAAWQAGLMIENTYLRLQAERSARPSPKNLA